MIQSAIRTVVQRVDERFRVLPSSKPVERLPRRLHLGAGGIRVRGWCNVDIDPGTRPDVVDDVLTLSAFPAGHAEAIYACHVLEHLPHAEVPHVLARWREVLSPGGELRISVPDLDRIVRIYCANWDHFHDDRNEPWIGLIYGGQTDKFDFHKTGFNFVFLRRLLREVGFADISEYAHVPHFLGIQDSSLANTPFGQYISLNVRATRPLAEA
jgi:predicted SAM-dependent methyltransferase